MKYFGNISISISINAILLTEKCSRPPKLFYCLLPCFFKHKPNPRCMLYLHQADFCLVWTILGSFPCELFKSKVIKLCLETLNLKGKNQSSKNFLFINHQTDNSFINSEQTNYSIGRQGKRWLYEGLLS